MIKEVIVYTVICDKCGKANAENSGHCGWTDKSYALDEALDYEWEMIDNKHYCPDCYEYDEDADEYKVKE